MVARPEHASDTEWSEGGGAGARSGGAIEDMAVARVATERGAHQEAAEILGNTLDQRKGPKIKIPSPLGDTLHGGHHQRHRLDPRLRLSSCPSCAPTSAGPVGSRINNEWASTFVTAGDIVQTLAPRKQKTFA